MQPKSNLIPLLNLQNMIRFKSNHEHREKFDYLLSLAYMSNHRFIQAIEQMRWIQNLIIFWVEKDSTHSSHDSEFEENTLKQNSPGYH